VPLVWLERHPATLVHTSTGAEWAGASYAYLDLTALGRQEDWEGAEGTRGLRAGRDAQRRELIFISSDDVW